MRNNIIEKTLLLLSILFLVNCGQDQASEDPSKRYIFDQGNLKVITTSINPTLETMSVLYGNDKAYKAALKGDGQHRLGEKYIYLTWKYIENPRWYGSNISENLICVEHLEVQGDERQNYVAFDYKIEQGTPNPVNGAQLSQKDRIAYILEHRPSVLP